MTDYPSQSLLPSRRIAFITSQAFSIHNFRDTLISELIGRGYTVYAIAPDYDDSSLNAVSRLGAIPIESSMSRAGMNPWRDVLDLIKLAKQLRSLHLDATFAYFIKPVIYGTLAARLAGIPQRFAMIEGAGYVFSQQNQHSCSRRLLRRAVTWLYRQALRQADTVFLLNNDDRQLFVEEKMVAESKVCLLNGIGLDLDAFRFAAPVIDPPCFLLAARLLGEKGVYDFVAAARQIKQRYPKARFLLLGATDVNPNSVKQSEIDGWVAEGLLECPGHVADVRPWLTRASVFVLPSFYREGLPRSIQEAMAMGRAIITTDWVGCRETVEQGVNGFKVPVQDVPALVQAMLKFVEQPDLIAPMGRASRQMAEERFDVRRINAAILAVIDEVVATTDRVHSA